MGKNRTVWAKIPRAGLANKVLVWANAYVFAKQNNAKLVVTNWLSIFIGPILRGEKSLRFYFGYFNNDSVLRRLGIRIRSTFQQLTKNPKTLEFPEGASIVQFDTYMTWVEFFERIRFHQKEIKQVFLNQLLKKEFKLKYDAFTSPQVAVHIRMGDFGKLEVKEGEFNHENVNSKRTPLDYFKEVIEHIKSLKNDVEVSIFSDGSKEELSPILEMDKVKLIEGNKDIEDLLLLSKSKVIVSSPTSTFSLFAAYLSDAAIIHHPNFFVEPIRNTDDNTSYFEGAFEKSDAFNNGIVSSLSD